MHGSAIVDLGTRLGAGSTVSRAGIATSAVPLGGYSLLQGESLEAGTKLFVDHPHLSLSGATIDVIEMMPLPGM